MTAVSSGPIMGQVSSLELQHRVHPVLSSNMAHTPCWVLGLSTSNVKTGSHLRKCPLGRALQTWRRWDKWLAADVSQGWQEHRGLNVCHRTILWEARTPPRTGVWAVVPLQCGDVVNEQLSNSENYYDIPGLFCHSHPQHGPLCGNFLALASLRARRSLCRSPSSPRKPQQKGVGFSHS
jgi:hypothetical protein